MGDTVKTFILVNMMISVGFQLSLASEMFLTGSIMPVIVDIPPSYPERKYIIRYLIIY